MDILMSETCWAHNNWNKITSDIKLVFHSSTIAMTHGPINIRPPIMFILQRNIVASWVFNIARLSSHLQLAVHPTRHRHYTVRQQINNSNVLSRYLVATGTWLEPLTWHPLSRDFSGFPSYLRDKFWDRALKQATVVSNSPHTDRIIWELTFSRLWLKTVGFYVATPCSLVRLYRYLTADNGGSTINIVPTFQRVPKRRYTRPLRRRVSLSLNFLRYYNYNFVVYIVPLN